jgi:Domain of unknown function (DUF1963)
MELPDSLRPFVYDQVLFRATVTALDEIEVGASRIAGPPDLPEGVDWPRAPCGRRMPLALQLRLADLPPGAATERLPRGTLWFFAAQSAAGGTAASPSGVPSAIVYAPADAALVRRALPPEAEDDTYWEPTKVSRVVDVRASTAFEPDEVFDELGLSTLDDVDDVQREALRNLTQPDDNEPVHVLFPVRSVGSYGVDPPDGWLALVELRSDDASWMNWGDAAWISFRVPSADLAAGRFDRGEGHVWIG